MFDVVVVGARCAGAPTAMLFARAGCRVLMLDQAKHLGDTLSTLYIQPAGVRLLGSWGVLADVLATGCPPITRRSFTIDGITIAGDTDLSCAPRRRHLDRVLAGAAVSSGAEFRQGWAVQDVLFDDGRAVGVRCRTPDGTQDVPARLVVGADGVRSRTATSVGATAYVEHPLRSCAYYTYWRGVPAQSDIHSAPGRAIGCFATHDDLTLVATYFPQERFPEVRRDALHCYLTNIREAAPELFDRMNAGEQAERLYGTGWQPNYLRHASGPGWALVGDAGHHKDSIAAQGITDAFHQAQLLFDCVGTEPSDPDTVDHGLSVYASVRDKLAEPNFESTVALAGLEVDPNPEQWRAVTADPVATGRVLAALGGDYPDDLASFTREAR